MAHTITTYKPRSILMELSLLQSSGLAATANEAEEARRLPIRPRLALRRLPPGDTQEVPVVPEVDCLAPENVRIFRNSLGRGA